MCSSPCTLLPPYTPPQSSFFQYDTNQLFAQLGVPKSPTKGSPEEKEQRDFIAYYGELMRNSTAQIKPGGKDGLFHPSCLAHGVSEDVAIDGGDWSNAALLVPTPDLLGRRQFGGAEREMERVQKYKRGLLDLKKKVKDKEDGTEEE